MSFPAPFYMLPGETSHMSVEKVYGRTHALEVVRASLADYDEHYGNH